MTIANKRERVKREFASNSSRARKRTKRKPLPAAPARFWLDIGKNISLMLTAAKYDFDLRLDGDQDDGGVA